MRLHHRAAVITAVAGLALTGAAGPALAATTSLSVDGTVSALNAARSTVTVATSVDASTVRPFVAAGSVTAVTATSVTVKRLTGAVDTLPVASKALVTLDGRAVAVSALPVRASVVVTGTVTDGGYAAKTVTALSRWTLNVAGTVSAVDAVAGTVTVNSDTGTKLTLKVDPKASVTVNGTKVSLANVPVGATVDLTGSDSVAGATVLGLTAKVNRAAR